MPDEHPHAFVLSNFESVERVANDDVYLQLKFEEAYRRD
jgi:hypothetical protein